MLFGFLSCQSQSSEKTNTGAGQPAPACLDVGAAGFKAKMSEPNLRTPDVRTPEEIAKVKIERAMELNFYEENFATEVGKPDEKKICLICSRSGKTCKLNPEQGFKKLYHLKGGYTAWSQQ